MSREKNHELKDKTKLSVLRNRNKKKRRKSEQSLRYLWVNDQPTQAFLRVPEGDERKGAEILPKEIMTTNFPNLMASKNLN